MKRILSFDFGASSGRAMLATLNNGKIEMEEIHRFSNDTVIVRGTMYWDVLRLFFEIKAGITAAVNRGGFDAIGIDTWGVDFGLLDKDGRLLENPVNYRDKRTVGVKEKAFEVCGKENMYKAAGLQFNDFNTIFQLYSLKLQRPELLERAETLLFIPDLLAYFLTGEKSVEYTIASTSELLDAKKRDYDFGMLEKLGIKKEIMPKIVKPGTVKGKLSAEIAEELGIDRIDVIASASHDTASAVAAAPIKKGESSCFISCGTWSLLGAELDEPIINDVSFAEDFTNEGGVENTIRFLKNISGLWLMLETRRQWIREGEDISFKDIDKMLETEKSADVYIDPTRSEFVAPGNMPKRIDDFLIRTNQKTPESKGQTALCILESLALTYRYYIEALEKILGRKIDVIHIIGGGVKDVNLCKFTANATGKKVTAGPVEATAIGNISVQLIAKGAIKDIESARKQISDVKEYLPEDAGIWAEKYAKFLKIKEL